ncbi:hypothetical protein [Pedobacter sp. MC2016-24]|uniref:hypothetical protein n=1 Tax=Pedobacter sp. MC2016-24 TaxID=2780090 RepID=UPI001880DD1B|nr:hypothetical protein [Pedobacter sp. MC2016-24]MBE9602989.1 hypothetical protein [Pedobacter sp. MC2016-24]
MKTILTTLLALVLFIHTRAQSNFYKMGIGAGAGFTRSYTDLAKHGYGVAGYGVFDYYFTPFLSLGVEGQMGEINSGDAQTDPAGRQAINRYKSVSINGKISLGALINYNRSGFTNVIKGLYLGAGAGIVQNDMKAIVRSKLIVDQNGQQVTDENGKPMIYTFPGKSKSKDPMIPLNLGINFYFHDGSGYYRYALNFNCQTTITLGEGLDGYDDSPIKFKNGSPDMYAYYTVGLRYHFGTMGLSRKNLY